MTTPRVLTAEEIETCRIKWADPEGVLAVLLDSHEELRREVERLECVEMNRTLRAVEAESEVTRFRALLKEAREVFEHAIELGYLGEGSTAGMAKDFLARLEKEGV